MNFNPYFLMDGDAEAAILLYAKAFGGEYQIMKYKDAPQGPGAPPLPGEMMELVMHGEVRFGETAIMVCDATPMSPVTKGNNVQVAVSVESADDVTRIHRLLAEGGQTLMAPQQTFFAQNYASVTDRFGVTWQLIAPKEETVETWT